MARQSLCDYVVEEIRNEIIAGKLKNGDKLPGEFELADKYSVSRFTIREAMKKLTSMGLVDVKHGVGSFFNILSPESYLKPLLPTILMSDQDIRSVCETRMAIETQTISLCVERITDEEIEELHKLCLSMEQAFAEGDHAEYNRYDLEFHLAIARAARNKMLYEILDSLQSLLAIQMTRTVELPDSIEHSIKRHKLMVEFLVDREEKLARDMMELHIADSLNALRGEKK